MCCVHSVQQLPLGGGLGGGGGQPTPHLMSPGQYRGHHTVTVQTTPLKRLRFINKSHQGLQSAAQGAQCVGTCTCSAIVLCLLLQ